MRNVLNTILVCLLILSSATFKANAQSSTFRDIHLNLMNANFITEEEQSSAVTFGVAIAEDGTATRVEADDASAAIVLKNFKYHDNTHGFTPGEAVVAVPGNVKISIGSCQYESKSIVVKDAAGNEVANFVANNGACYSASNSEVVEKYYTGEATTLTISGGNYVPYIGIEAVDVAPSKYAVTYSLGSVSAEGTVPSATELTAGESFKIPTNHTLYIAGKTLTAWTDGEKEYKIGEEVTPTADLNLTPVFTDNTVSLEQRNGEVTATWNFQTAVEAALVKFEGNKGIYVTPITVNGETIDLKMDIDATSGKFNNSNGNWSQVNNGTVLTFPAAKNCTIKFMAYNEVKETTIAGDTNYTLEGGSGSYIGTYVYGGKESTIDMVINDGSYYRYFTITYPEIVSNIQERPIIATDFTDWQSVSSTSAPVDVEVTTSFSNEKINFNFNGVTVAPSGQNTSKFGDLTGYAMAEKSADGIITTSAFANITRVRYYHGATGSKRGYKLEKKSAADTDWVVLSDAYADPAAGVWVEKDINEENVQLRWTNINTAQNAYMFELQIYSNVEITTNQVKLTLAASPEEGGSVAVSPSSDEFDEGTEVTLTAKRNFGWAFTKWIDAAGSTLSTESTFKITLNADLQATAVFEQMKTYSLTTSVDGANYYMVEATPDATVVDKKNMYEEGTTVTLTALENPVIKFSNWDDGNTSVERKITMDSDKSYTAVYNATNYIVGWDFILKGNNGRPADYASTTDNETTTLVLRNAEGTTTSWLDKSKASGSYEGGNAAVNWQNLSDKFYYETKINATDFTDIAVTSQMLYNYNAYATQKLEYSLNGTDFTTVATVTIPGNKVWTPVEATLPAECNHAATLYLRWIPDYTSDVVGTSGNDGTSLAEIYVTGKPSVYDDGTAPVLVSSVPTNGATGASASGRVVLTFDEKVQLLDGAAATIGSKTVEGTVAGKNITFAYMALSYNTEYTFNLPANSVADLAGNTLKEAISIKFTTMAPPTVTPGMYDAVVTNGDELLEAITKGNEQAANGARFRIFLPNGTYDLGEKCLTTVKSNISLIGESMEGTIIVNKAPTEGISVSATLLTTGSNIYMQDLTLQNAYDYTGTTGRAVCLQDKGDKNVLKNVRMLSYQDTYYSNNNRMRSYMDGCEIHGTVDFICGGGDVFFNQSTFYLEDRSSNCITAPAGDTDWGYVFNDCIIDGADSNKGSYALGRPWQGAPMSVWINTTMKVLPKAEGWSEMSTTIVPKLFAEYNSHTESGMAVDCSARKTTYTAGTVTYNPVLTAEEAAKFTVDNVLSGSDAWQPALLTEQVQAPTLTLAGSEISWEASNYVFCYAVLKNGKVVDFTNDNKYTIPADATSEDVFSVRAANEMGGLGAASNGVSTSSATGIEESVATGEVVETIYFTPTGVRVNAPQKGVNIVRTVYSDGKVKTSKVVIR